MPKYKLYTGSTDPRRGLTATEVEAYQLPEVGESPTIALMDFLAAGKLVLHNGCIAGTVAGNGAAGLPGDYVVRRVSDGQYYVVPREHFEKHYQKDES